MRATVNTKYKRLKVEQSRPNNIPYSVMESFRSDSLIHQSDSLIHQSLIGQNKCI